MNEAGDNVEWPGTPAEQIPGHMIDISEKCETEWRNYLSEFREKVYPIFATYGISIDAALTVWFINRQRISIDDLAEEMKNDSDSH